MPSTELRYQSGFGNEFATEAAAGALPVGQNSPQQAPLGLYAEQLSGSPFTAPRATNRRTWTYRIRPSVPHQPFSEYPAGLLRSGPFDEVPTPPNQLRWDPFPIPEAAAVATLEEQAPGAFHFDDRAAAWHVHVLTTEQLREAREQFAISFGSCSFEEPIHDLHQLGWL